LEDPTAGYPVTTTIYIYLRIKQKCGQHPDWVRHADSVFLAGHNAITMIENIKQTLSEKDAGGENTQVATKLLVHTAASLTLADIDSSINIQTHYPASQ
jgi:hypothetical protein